MPKHKKTVVTTEEFIDSVEAPAPAEEKEGVEEVNVSKVDQDIAAAKARVASATPPAPTVVPSPEAVAAARAALEAERAAKKAKRDAARAEKNAVRDAERATKRAMRDAKRAAKMAERAERGPAHMSKVQKAAARLPAMLQDTQNIFDDASSILGLDQITALAEHLMHFVRAKSTTQALNQKLVAGQVVRIRSGNTRFIGQIATVVKAQRIRCYVAVPGYDREIYLFSSDVEPIASSSAEEIPADKSSSDSATGTEG